MQGRSHRIPEPVPDDPANPGGFKHVPALDGIRGLAILLVLVHHLTWSNSVTGSRFFDLVQKVCEATYCGVNLFFALSGFLITGILIDTLNVPHYFRTFYARRSLRIFPLYYGALIALLLLTRPMHFTWNGWQYFFLTYTTNLALWRPVPLDLGFFNINHFWSLQVEEQFYLVWPFIVYNVRRTKTLLRLSLAACAGVLGIRTFLVLMHAQPAFQSSYLLLSPTFSCADNILFGCALCAALRTSWRSTVIRFAPRVLALCAAILLIAAIRNGSFDWTTSSFLKTLGFSLIGIAGTALIVMTLQPGSKTQSLFQNSFLRFFGKYSYGIYVFHYSIQGALATPLRGFIDSRLHSKALGVGLSALIVAALSVAVALASYYLYERPFLNLKRFFSYNKSTKVPARLEHIPAASATN